MQTVKSGLCLQEFTRGETDFCSVSQWVSHRASLRTWLSWPASQCLNHCTTLNTRATCTSVRWTSIPLILCLTSL